MTPAALSREGRAQRGASLMELMFVMAIGTTVILAMTRFITKARGSMSREETTSELIASNRRIQNNLTEGLRSADLMLLEYPSNDTAPLRTVILNSISSTSSPAPVSFSKRAIPQDTTIVDFTSASADKWGNEMFYVESLPPVTFTVAVSGTAGTAILASSTTATYAQTFNVSVDRVQFVAIYLSQDTKHAMKGGMIPLRLVEWRSKPMATLDVGRAVANPSDWTPPAVLTGTCQALIAAGYNTVLTNEGGGSRVLNTTTGATGGYFTISNTATFTNINIPANLGRASWAYLDEFQVEQRFSINASTDLGRVARERTGKGFSGPASYSIAYNTVNPTVNPSLKVNKLIGVAEKGNSLVVPAYASPDLGGLTGFPAGFEVAVIGRAGSREVLMRMVQMASSGTSPAINEGIKDFLGVESESYVTVNNLY